MGPTKQRAVDNFQISDYKMPTGFIRSLALLKWGLANANKDLNLLSKESICYSRFSNGNLSRRSYERVSSGCLSNWIWNKYHNMNEVISHLASSESNAIHPTWPAKAMMSFLQPSMLIPLYR